MEFPQAAPPPGKYLTAAEARQAIDELARDKERQQAIARAPATSKDTN